MSDQHPKTFRLTCQAPNSFSFGLCYDASVMNDSFLEVRDLRKSYGATVALAGVSFAVGRGEMFGLLGPNGAGKTTLLSILSCLLEPTGGEARILGRKVVANDPELRRQIGIVPQELALYGELTGRENLLFFGGLYGVSGKALAQRCDE